MKNLAMNRGRISIAALALCGYALCGSPAQAASKQELDARVHQAVDDLYRSSPAARELAGKAAGILVFPSVIKAGLWVGGEYGQGELLIGGSSVAYYNIVSASVGLQAGVQDEGVALLFMTQEALNRFRQSQGWKAGVDGSVAIATLGAGEAIDTETMKKPVIGFEFSNKGLMANLTLEGTKISRIEK